MARVKEFWTYQRLNVAQPWALVNYVTFDRTRELPYSWRFDTVFYAEWIPNHHSDSSLYNRTYRDGGEFAAAVAAVAAKYGHNLEDADIDQLINAWIDVINTCYN